MRKCGITLRQKDLAKVLYDCRILLRNKRNVELAKEGFWPDSRFVPSDEEYAEAILSFILTNDKI